MAGLKAMTLNSYISALLSSKSGQHFMIQTILGRSQWFNNAENFWKIVLMFLMNKNHGRFQECLLLWRNWETEVSSIQLPFEIFYLNTTFSFIGMQMTLSCICFVNLFCESSSLQSRNQIIQFCMKSIDEWMTSNKLKLPKARPNLY